MAEGDVERAIAALRAGRPVLLPTDTVYGLCASPYRAAPIERLYRVKGRDLGHPTALLATTHDLLFECVPELRGRAGVIARAVLPGPYTLVLPNPARRFRWLTGTRPDTIGVRIPELPDSSRRVVEAVGAVAATSANAAGGADPAAPDDVPAEILIACGAVLREGRLPGTPSTVIDFTGPKPVVLRQGAAPADEAIARADAAVGR